MASQRAKKLEQDKLQIGSPGSVKQFRAFAAAFTKEATKSKAAATKVLKSEGILTPKGNLSKRYSVK